MIVLSIDWSILGVDQCMMHVVVIADTIKSFVFTFPDG